MAIQNPATNCYENENGESETQKGAGGAARVASSGSSFGTISVAELVGTDTEASTEYSFPNGLNGVSISNYCPTVWNTAIVANVLVYAAFNNTPFDSADQVGLRYVIGPNQTMELSFDTSPKPTKMTLRVDSLQCTVFHVAAGV